MTESKEEDFKINEFCWVQLEGYQTWPAYIIDIRPTYYRIQFIGDIHEGNITKKELIKWTKENTAKFFSNCENYKDVFEGAIKFKKYVEKGILSFDDYWDCYYYCLDEGKFNKINVQIFKNYVKENLNDEKKYIKKKNINKKIIFKSPLIIKIPFSIINGQKKEQKKIIENEEIKNEDFLFNYNQNFDNNFLGNKRKNNKEENENNDYFIEELNKILNNQIIIKKETQNIIDAINQKYNWYKSSFENKDFDFNNKNIDISKKIEFLNFLYVVCKLFQRPFLANNHLKDTYNEIKIKFPDLEK